MKPKTAPQDFSVPTAVLRVKVSPSAGRDRVMGWMGEELKLAVSAPPERGKANEAVLKLLAEKLGSRVSELRIVQGEHSGRKRLLCQGLSQTEAMKRLGGATPREDGN